MARLESETEDQPSRLARLWEQAVAAPLRQVDEEARAYMASRPARGVDGKVITVLLTAALVLTVQYYLVKEPRLLARGLAGLGFESLAERFTEALQDQLTQKLYWWAGCVVGWVVVPALVIRLGFRERVRDYGLKLQGLTAGWWLYLLMLAAVLPLVVLSSRWPSFQETYPLYHLADDEPLGPRFWCWELAYAAQFLALEFFFRGFMIHGTRHRFGCYSILVMVVPYCMIHYYGKPLPEALGSIVAGLALGFMSLKTRSVWMGTALHVTVALTMDFLALGLARLR